MRVHVCKCSHDKASHFELDAGTRGACLSTWCDCKGYVETDRSKPITLPAPPDSAPSGTGTD